MDKKNEKSKDVGRKMSHTLTGEDEVFISGYGLSEIDAAVNPFERRSSVARTPPPGPKSDSTKGKEESKRMRSGDSPLETAKRSRWSELHMGVSGIIGDMEENIKELYQITSGSRNTKVEIKDIAEKLIGLTNKLTCIDLSELGKAETADKCETREMSTQTDQRARLRSRMADRNDPPSVVTSLEDCHTFEKWREVEKRKWAANLFTRTEVEDGGDILTTEESVVKVVITTKEGNVPRNKRIWDRYPELQASPSEYAVLEQINNLRGGSVTTIARKIIKFSTDGSEEDLWSKLTRTKDEIALDGRIALQQVPGRSVNFMRKMLECVFLHTSARVVIYTDKDSQRKKITSPQERPTRERDTYALVVEGSGGEAYTEVLRRVKERVRTSTVSGNIKGLRSTRDGRLLITTDKDPSVAARVAEVLSEPDQHLKIRKTGQKRKEMAIHIRGLDALATKQEVVEAVEKKIGPLTGKTFRVSELRPNAGDTLAATFVTDKEDAIKIIEGGTLRIGLVNCRVEKKLEIERCFRCWSYDHKARECDAEIDRSGLCYRCGTGGHNAKACTGDEACPICGEGGHTADSRKCHFFKKALAQARETERRKASANTHEERRTATSMAVTNVIEPDRGPGPTGAQDPP